jgi:putative transposase
MCEVLGVSRSGYYDWCGRSESARSRENRSLLNEIQSIHQSSRTTYGYRRIHAELKARGQSPGRHRVARLMRQAGMKPCMQRVWACYRRGEQFVHSGNNRLAREFHATQPNERWVTDITQVPTAEGWVYVAVVIDLYSRKVVGWSLSSKQYQGLTDNALQMALWRRGNPKGLMVHSDQGVPYRTESWHQLLKNNELVCSMSRRGNCLDNAVVESFFHSMKTEHTHHYRYRTRQEAKQSIFDYIEVFYNNKRRHSYLGYRSPVEFEKQRDVA